MYNKKKKNIQHYSQKVGILISCLDDTFPLSFPFLCIHFGNDLATNTQVWPNK